MNIDRLFANSFFSIISKLTNALIQVLCLPILLKVFGKESYGLIVIAMSLNTLFVFLQLGLPTGIPKFVAEWLAKGDRKELNTATRTIFTFYLLIGIVNLLVIFAIAFFGTGIFNIEPHQIDTLKTLLVITAVTSCLSIPLNLLDQILTGAHNLGFISKLQMINNLFFAFLVAFIYFNPDVISLVQFYIMRCFLLFIMVPVKLWKWRMHGELKVFFPGWNFETVVPILKYCISLMTFSIFIALADRLRPIILGIQNPFAAGEVLAEYQILNYIRILFLMLTSSFMAALIPYISGTFVNGNYSVYNKTINLGTKYIWTFGALVGFGLITLSKETISIYVGVENLHLKNWFELMVIGSLYNLYVAAITSVILSSGKLKPMIFATSIGFIISVSICWFLTPVYSLGAIVISIIAYNAIHLIVTHFWYLPRYFKVKVVSHLKNIMFPPVFAGVMMCFCSRLLIDIIGSTNDFINLTIGALSGSAIYIIIISIAYIRPAEVRELFVKIKMDRK